MDKNTNLFKTLKLMLSKSGENLVCTVDEKGEYSLSTRHIMKNKKNMFFGAVKERKNDVSYHLMPVYVFPEILVDVSPALKKRMHGKSCFNFRSVDNNLFEELNVLTITAYDRFCEAGYL